MFTSTLKVIQTQQLLLEKLGRCSVCPSSLQLVHGCPAKTHYELTEPEEPPAQALGPAPARARLGHVHPQPCHG